MEFVEVSAASVASLGGVGAIAIADYLLFTMADMSIKMFAPPLFYYCYRCEPYYYWHLLLPLLLICLQPLAIALFHIHTNINLIATSRAAIGLHTPNWAVAGMIGAARITTDYDCTRRIDYWLLGLHYCYGCY